MPRETDSVYCVVEEARRGNQGIQQKGPFLYTVQPQMSLRSHHSCHTVCGYVDGMGHLLDGPEKQICGPVLLFHSVWAHTLTFIQIPKQVSLVSSIAIRA